MKEYLDIIITGFFGIVFVCVLLWGGFEMKNMYDSELYSIKMDTFIQRCVTEGNPVERCALVFGMGGK